MIRQATLASLFPLHIPEQKPINRAYMSITQAAIQIGVINVAQIRKNMPAVIALIIDSMNASLFSASRICAGVTCLE